MLPPPVSSQEALRYCATVLGIVALRAARFPQSLCFLPTLGSSGRVGCCCWRHPRPCRSFRPTTDRPDPTRYLSMGTADVSSARRPSVSGGEKPADHQVIAASAPATTAAPVENQDEHHQHQTESDRPQRSSRRRADTSARAASVGRASLPSTSSVVLDRRLLAQYEQINQEIDRVVRLSTSQFDGGAGPQSLPAGAASEAAALHQVKADLRRVKQSSSKMIQSQKDLLEKMERQERGGVRRFFTLNKQAKLAKLRAKLSDKLSESVRVDEELERLERQSDMLARTSLAAVAATQLRSSHSLSHGASSRGPRSLWRPTEDDDEDDEDDDTRQSSESLAMLSPEDVQEELELLEREKEDILTNLFQSADLPDAADLHAKLASLSAEIQAATSVKKQVDKVETMYRKALHLLRVALAAVVSPSYSGGIREFATSAYPLAVEAGHLVEAASHVVQPEARRRYHEYAPELAHVRPPKFPQAVQDFARRSRTHFDPHSALAIEGMRHLRAAENVVILLQRLVIQKLEVLDKWQQKLARDLAASEKAHAQLDARLQEQVAVLARSISV